VNGCECEGACEGELKVCGCEGGTHATSRRKNAQKCRRGGEGRVVVLVALVVVVVVWWCGGGEVGQERRKCLAFCCACLCVCVCVCIV
jgi:hypothetical protein